MIEALGEVARKRRVAAAGTARKAARLQRGTVDGLAVADDGFGVVCDQNFLGAPFAEHERGLFAVGRAGQHLGLGGVGLEVVDHRQILHLIRPVAQLQGAVVVAAAEQRLHIDADRAALGACFDDFAGDIAVNEAAEVIDLRFGVGQVGHGIRLDHGGVQALAALTVRREVRVLHLGAGLGFDGKDFLHLAVLERVARVETPRVALRHDRYAVADGRRRIAGERDRAARNVLLAPVIVNVVIERDLADNHGIKHVAKPPIPELCFHMSDTGAYTAPM